MRNYYTVWTQPYFGFYRDPRKTFVPIHKIQTKNQKRYLRYLNGSSCTHITDVRRKLFISFEFQKENANFKFFTKNETYRHFKCKLRQRRRTHKQHTCTNAAGAHLSRNDWPFPYMLVFMNADDALAQSDTLRWTGCQRARYLRSPVPLPTTRNRMVLQNKTANKGRAANVRATGPGRTFIEGSPAAGGFPC